MKKPLKTLALTALAVGTTAGALCIAHRGQASVGTCTERFMVIGSRGSGSDFGDDPVPDKYHDVVKGMGTSGNAFAAAFAGKFPRGEVSFLRNYFPAKGGLVSLLGAITRVGPLGAYKASVAEGNRDLKGLITREIGDCPKVKLILVGYSQGAQVTGDTYQALPSDQKRHVAGVVLFGDPEFNPDDPADQSQYEKSEHGALGNRGIFSPDVPVLSYCHVHDPVCQWPLTHPACRHLASIGCKALAAEALVYRFTKHTNYTALGEPQDAAQKLYNELKIGVASNTGQELSFSYTNPRGYKYLVKLHLWTPEVGEIPRVPGKFQLAIATDWSSATIYNQTPDRQVPLAFGVAFMEVALEISTPPSLRKQFGNYIRIQGEAVLSKGSDALMIPIGGSVATSVNHGPNTSGNEWIVPEKDKESWEKLLTAKPEYVLVQADTGSFGTSYSTDFPCDPDHGYGLTGFMAMFGPGGKQIPLNKAGCRLANQLYYG